MKNHTLYKKYPAFKSHIEQDVLPRKDSWSLLYRIHQRLPTSSVNTTNYVESSFRWTKEYQFNRHRAYNLLELLKIVMDDSQYHARRCIDMGNNLLTRRLNNQKSRYLAKKCSIDPSKIVRIDSSTFLVPSETKKEVLYEVNMDLRLCECYMGQLKGPCKHKSISISIRIFLALMLYQQKIRRCGPFLCTWVQEKNTIKTGSNLSHLLGQTKYNPLESWMELGMLQRGSSPSDSTKARANSLKLDWLSSARSFLSFEPLARLSSIISKV